MPGGGGSLLLPPRNQSDYSGMGVAWKTSSSEVMVKAVVSLWKRCTQPGGWIQVSNSEVWVLGFQGGKVFVIALSKLRTAVTSATNITRLNSSIYWAHLFRFSKGPPPYGMFQCQRRLAGITALSSSLPVPACHVLLVRRRSLRSGPTWLTLWPTSPNICHRQRTIQKICFTFHNALLQILQVSVIPNILSRRVCVTIDGVWIDEWIYWPLAQTTRNYRQLNATANLHNWYDMDCIEKTRFQQIFFAAGTCLPSRCLTMKGEIYKDGWDMQPQTGERDLWSAPWDQLSQYTYQV
jgi:hypothetical protein